MTAIRRDIITIGGSAGSIQALRTIVERLPSDLPAALFVVIHRSTADRSFLAQVLDRAGALPAAEASDNEHIDAGRIYIAPADHHLLIAEDHVHLTRGPKEGLHRPSINMMFRSAAQVYRKRVIGVLLSGNLDDGASGLWEIAHQGGIAVIQDPDEAQFPSMPLQALKDAPINYELRATEIAARLVKLTNDVNAPDFQPGKFINDVVPERFSGFTCPECRGPLFEHRKEPVEFRCRVGHIFPLRTLIAESASTRERKMYEAIVSLEEGSELSELVAKTGEADERPRFLAEAEELRRCALAIRRLVEQPEITLLDDGNSIVGLKSSAR